MEEDIVVVIPGGGTRGERNEAGSGLRNRV